MHLKIFVSSPGDVQEERVLAERVLKRLGDLYREQAELSVILWEHEPLLAHADFQSQITRPSECDLVISILWSRLGTRLPPGYAGIAGIAGTPPPTGTEYEILDALEARRRFSRPDLLVYRRAMPPKVAVDRTDAREAIAQYEALDSFCQRVLVGASLAHHPYGEPSEFERLLSEHLQRWLERRVGQGRAKPRWLQGSPYRGLQTFEREHRDIYFGRSQAVTEVLKRLRAVEAARSSPRFLLLQGMSGIGKSSLIRAGLLPFLEGRAVEGVEAWQHIEIKPSAAAPGLAAQLAFGSLATELLKSLPGLREAYPAAELAERLASAPDETVARLDGYLGRWAAGLGLAPSTGRLVVCIDPLEECWTTLEPEMRDRLARCLWALAREGRVWIVAAIRSDFVAAMEETAAFHPLLTHAAGYTLLPPQPDELGEIVREPAAAAGLVWDREDGVSLDQFVLREAATHPEALPLLQFALDQLHERREGHLLTFHAYRSMGGLPGSVAAAAEECVAMNGSGHEACRQVFRLLVRVSAHGIATRRYAQREAFKDPQARSLLASLEARRLCVFDGEPDSTSRIGFAHEALLHAWPRLRRWLPEETGLLQAREMLDHDAQEWERRGRPQTLLAAAPEKLSEGHRLRELGVPLEELTSQFVAASLSRTRRLRGVRVATLVGVAALATTAAVAAALALGQRDDRQRALAQALASEGSRALADGDRAAALRLTAEAGAAWRDRTGQPDAEVAFARQQIDLVREVDLSSGAALQLTDWHFSSLVPRKSSLLFLRTRTGDVAVVDPVAGRTRLLKNIGSEIVGAMAEGPASYILVDKEGRVVRYDAATGDHIGIVPNATPDQGMVVSCDEGQCHALGWNQQTRQCEYVRIDAHQAPRALRLVAAGDRSPGAGGFDAPPNCDWRRLLVLEQGGGLLAVDQKHRAFVVRTDSGAALASLLRDDVTNAAVTGAGSVLLKRGDVLEAVDLASGRSERVLDKAAQVSTLGVSVANGLVAALSDDGSAAVVRDGRPYSLGRTGLVPLRMFELARTRAVLEVNTSGLIRVVDYRNGRQLYRWQGANSELRAAYFSAQNHRLSLLTTAGTLHIWDVTLLAASDLRGAAPTAAGPALAAPELRTSSVPLRVEDAVPLPGADALGVPLLVDANSGMALLGEGFLLHGGRRYRLADFRPVGAVTDATGSSWLTWDDRRLIGLRASARGESVPLAEVRWQRGDSDDSVQRAVALGKGAVLLALQNAVVLQWPAELAGQYLQVRVKMDTRLSEGVASARLWGDLLEMETSDCTQRRIHRPSGRNLYEVNRICE